jgi:hypothetical protein
MMTMVVVLMVAPTVGDMPDCRGGAVQGCGHSGGGRGQEG